MKRTFKRSYSRNLKRKQPCHLPATFQPLGLLLAGSLFFGSSSVATENFPPTLTETGLQSTDTVGASNPEAEASVNLDHSSVTVSPESGNANGVYVSSTNSTAAVGLTDTDVTVSSGENSAIGIDIYGKEGLRVTLAGSNIDASASGATGDATGILFSKLQGDTVIDIDHSTVTASTLGGKATALASKYLGEPDDSSAVNSLAVTDSILSASSIDGPAFTIENFSLFGSQLNLSGSTVEATSSEGPSGGIVTYSVFSGNETVLNDSQVTVTSSGERAIGIASFRYGYLEDNASGGSSVELDHSAVTVTSVDGRATGIATYSVFGLPDSVNSSISLVDSTVMASSTHEKATAVMAISSRGDAVIDLVNSTVSATSFYAGPDEYYSKYDETNGILAIIGDGSLAVNLDQSTVTASSTENDVAGLRAYNYQGDNTVALIDSSVTASSVSGDATGADVSSYSGDASVLLENSEVSASTQGDNSNASGIIGWGYAYDDEGTVEPASVTVTLTDSTVTASASGEHSYAEGVDASSYSYSYYGDANGGPVTVSLTDSTVTSSTIGDGSEAVAIYASSSSYSYYGDSSTSHVTVHLTGSTVTASTTGDHAVATGIYTSHDNESKYGSNNEGNTLITLESSMVSAVGTGAYSEVTGIRASHDSYQLDEYPVGPDNMITLSDSTISATSIGENSFAAGIYADAHGANVAIEMNGSTVTAEAEGDNSTAFGIISRSEEGDSALIFTDSRVVADSEVAVGVAASSHPSGLVSLTLTRSEISGSTYGISTRESPASITLDANSSVSGYTAVAGSAAYVTNSGLVSGRLEISDLNNTATGILQVNLDNSVDSTYGDGEAYLIVSNSATLADGSTFLVRPDSRLLSPGERGSYYLLNSGNTVSGWNQDALQLEVGPLYDISWITVADATQQLAIDLALKDFTDPIASGFSPNAGSAALDLYTHHPEKFTANSGSDPESWVPDMGGGAISSLTSLQQGVGGMIRHRLNQFSDLQSWSGSGINTGDRLPVRGIWGEIWQIEADQDTRDGINGYDARTTGVSVGYDQEYAPGSRVGFAFTWGDSESDTMNATSSVDTISRSLAFYGQGNSGVWNIQAGFFYSKGDNQAVRYGGAERIIADYDSSVAGLSAQVSRPLSVKRWLVQPQLTANYSRIHVTEYTEQGNSTPTSLALQVAGQDYSSFEVGCGVRVQRRFTLGKGLVIPDMEAMLYHDFSGDRIETTSSFTDGTTSFTTLGAEPAQDTWQFAFGLTYETGTNMSFRMSYDFTGRDDYQANSLNAQLRYEF